MVGAAFRNVTKVFDDTVVALDHLDLDVEPGEFVSIVGRSGCGKSTALRILAGLDDVTDGAVLIGGRDVTRVPTRKRNVGLVTQRDALLTRRTGRGNIRFPLEHRRGPRRGSPDEVVSAQATELGIEALLDRRPSELSSGERRAVQLARAVVARPDVLLLDEPLAFMDDGLRRRLRADIVRIQRHHGVTSVLVTADQDDAISMSDRIALLVDGRLHQIGSPTELIHQPATTDVAAFFGEPAMNLLDVPVRVSAGERHVTVLGRAVRVLSPLLDVYDGGEVVLGIRPGDLAVDETTTDSVPVRVESTMPLGHRTDLRVSTDGGDDMSVTVDGPGPRAGSVIRVGFRPDRFHWFDPGTGMAILHPAYR